MLFVVAGVVFSMVSARSTILAFHYLSLVALIGFLFIAIAHTFRQVAFGTDLSFNRVVGAICVYLLLGVIWALSYSVLELAVPGSFAGFEAHVGRGWDSERLYFSSVTMTTLGYGDLRRFRQPHGRWPICKPCSASFILRSLWRDLSAPTSLTSQSSERQGGSA